MKIEGIGFEDALIDVKLLDHTMNETGFVRTGSWDYERATYDYKMETPNKNITYYLRVRGYSVEGDIDRGDAVIKLLTPLLGKHYYPHGIEYGEGEDFPENIIEKSKMLLNRVSEKVEKLKK